MPADEVLLADLRGQVRRELLASGCPQAVASRLAGEVAYEPFSPRPGDDPAEAGWWLTCRGDQRRVESLDDPADVSSAVLELVQDIVDDNAEAHDRTSRGESGYEPLWPLPNRRPRHR